MSAHSHDHSHDHGHGDYDDGGADHGSYRSYLTGFGLAVILTVIPFAAVMQGWFESRLFTALFISGFAMVQVLVHMVYFLHMNRRSQGGWTLISLIFTLIVVGITLSGTLWVMHNMNANMMPSHLPVD